MDQYMQVLEKSVNFPRNLNLDYKVLLTFPVSADEFQMRREELVISGMAAEAVAYVQKATEDQKREYTLLLCGERRVNSTFLRDYSLCAGAADTASFTKDQLKHAKQAYKQSAGEVVYAHTHVANGDNYNCFSINDLRFMVERALQNKRDAYGMLITKDGVVAIKYSVQDNEFFKIRVIIA